MFAAINYASAVSLCLINKREMYDWCFLTCSKLEIISFSFHCRVIQQQTVMLVACVSVA